MRAPVSWRVHDVRILVQSGPHLFAEQLVEITDEALGRQSGTQHSRTPRSETDSTKLLICIADQVFSRHIEKQDEVGQDEGQIPNPHPANKMRVLNGIQVF